MENFVDSLCIQIEQKRSAVCLGLDPIWASLPERVRCAFIDLHGKSLKAVSRAFVFFCCEILDRCHDLVSCVKTQQIRFECYGEEGLKALYAVEKHAHHLGLIVIRDAKKNDIGSTMQAYADGILGKYGPTICDEQISPVDALTVNAYLGEDGVRPFFDKCTQEGKGVFILVKTSNPSSSQLQDKFIFTHQSFADGSAVLMNSHHYHNVSVEDIMNHFGKPVWRVVADLTADWGRPYVGLSGYSSIGAVVGATHSNFLGKVRELYPDMFLLIPGYGHQGGTAKDVAVAFDANGRGAVVNSSGAINYAYLKGNQSYFADASRKEVIRMNKDINSYRKV